ncbi:putative cysteine desulfurase [Pirellula sp. SH-Sr6A]|uniref:aminotransferase class V-fold PLP-dependent enzyme n=1 Tax=Pirellula sp. SH-Sr6A TaxID=1632865 RepID=UPI00078EEC49|nr:aminotransferase class V-fold PLP-dependent enzyme [Pirellula sp. SH-Sr6A]AMV30747.1 putative cysteine desulfurase [Pirellula sp. SH-Sr6A]
MRNYLDHAATSWPKAPSVLTAVEQYLRECGAAAGRGSYRSALDAEKCIHQTRVALAERIGAVSPLDIAFCSNGTQALNASIFGIALRAHEARSPLHVLTTATEHNSVLRPLALAEQRGWLTWDAIRCDETGLVDLDDVEQAVTPETRWLIVNHVSNVTGAIQPIQAWRELADRYGIRLMVDAAQSAGMLPLDMRSTGIDILAAPCHKGLGSILGCAFLAVVPKAQSELAPLWIGGTGSSSDAITGEFGWLETMESGNRNMPAIASLHASLQCERMDRPERWEPWVERILAEIRDSKRLRLIGPDTPSSRTRLPVISIAPHPGEAQPGICQEWAMVLESTLGIECRAGFHCAGRIHEHLGTIASGGTLRFSLGHTTSEADIDAVCEGIRLLEDVF